MGILKRILGKNKSKKTVNTEKQQLINDSEVILSILKNAMRFNSIQFTELESYFYQRMGIIADGEGRVLKALNFLSKNNIIGFGGNKGNTINFNKRALPTSLPVLDFGVVL